MRLHRHGWDEIGRLDALWAVLSEPSKRYGGWNIDEFLATGTQEVSAVLDAAARWGLPRRRRHALDFGCGVGRLTRALAAHFEMVSGVDIAPTMIDLARKLNSDIPTCNFRVLEGPGLSSFPDRSLDFVYSRLVLQHITRRRVAQDYIREFVRVLADDGLIVFQVPSALPLRRHLQLRPRLYATLRRLGLPDTWLYRRLGLHPIRMCAIQENNLIELLTDAGAEILDI